jgi:hypothetical protein
MRLSEAGLVIAKSYRQLLFKVNMQGGCWDHVLPVPRRPRKLPEPAPAPEPVDEIVQAPRPLRKLDADEVRRAADSVAAHPEARARSVGGVMALTRTPTLSPACVLARRA